jgi:NAD-dependent SIR2 family protein deacetylase
MQFCDAGPDVPDELIRAQLAGDVVLVIGAGVPQRVGLPSFAQLVARVYERLGQAWPGTADSLADIAEVDAWNRKEWDRTLGLLEQRLVYPNPNRPESTSIVRQAVAEILTPPRGRSGTHQDILQISRDAFGRPRVVTTNFDTLFERAWRTSRPDPLVSSLGPGLPAVGSSDFQGVIHLHGRIADARLRLGASSLVLTSGDFGEAYLRSGWASRFVYDLLRRYTLVFVGYSADDPPMRYMLEATEAGRLHFPDLRRAYAFASFGDDADSDEGSVRARWRAKGLVPIPYENGDGCYDNLYDTLSAWAACTRDPAGWAEAEIGRLVAVPFSDASTAVQQKVTFLTTALASTTVLSSRAAFFDWVDCLIDTQSSPPLSDRDALIWLEHRLADRDLVRWAIEAAGSIKAVIARAAAMHLATPKQPVPDLFRKYWRVYAATYSDRSPGNQFDWLEVRRKVTGAHDYFTIEAVTQLVRPRLQLGRAWPRFGDPAGEGEPEPSLLDLCTVNFECADWPSWTELLVRWPNESDAEARLLSALGRVLAQACELAREAGFIRPDWDGASRAVQLVHALEPAEAEIPTLDEGFRKDHWQPTDSDQHDHSFVPIVRLMSGLWRRLVEHASDRASSIARSWIDEEAKLFRRLGYWAATISEHGPIDRAAELLAKVSRETFWIEERSAEGARFWCGRWNSLPPKTRRTLEANILRGPQGEWMWLAEDKRRATDFARHRELARIATAGGRLSARAQRAFTRLAARLENPPVQVSVVEGLRQRSWSGWGRRGDISLVAETPDERLLEHVDEIEGRDPINQSGLWAAVCGDMPDKALAALVQARARDQWPAARWREFLNRSRMEFGKGINAAQVTVVAEALGGMPEDVLRDITPSFGGWLKSLSSVDRIAEMRSVILSSWDRLLASRCREIAGGRTPAAIRAEGPLA